MQLSTQQSNPNKKQKIRQLYVQENQSIGCLCGSVCFSSRSRSHGLRLRRRRDRLRQHLTEAIPAITPLRATMRFSASQPASATRPSVFMRCIVTRPATPTRPSVLNALFSNTTGNYNTANGSLALNHNTTGRRQHGQRLSSALYNTLATTTRPAVIKRSLTTPPATDNTANGFRGAL